MNIFQIHTLLFIPFIIFSGFACQRGHSEQQAPINIPDTTMVAEEPAPAVSATPSEDTLAIPLDIQYIMGRFDPAKHPDFILIESKYTDKEGSYLRKDTYRAFVEMYNHAL